MKKIILAVPKGRILEELIPVLEKADIKPEESFFESESRKLLFGTKQKNINIIRVRAFDVATFVAFGAAQVGIAGDDVLNEFNYNEINKVLDLKIGKCRLSVAANSKLIKTEDPSRPPFNDISGSKPIISLSKYFNLKLLI